MDAPGITGPTPTNPAYGVGSLKYNRDRQNKQSFEEAFAEEEQSTQERGEQSVAEDNTSEKAPPPADLQEAEGIIRKDEEDGQLHVDIVV